MNAMRRIYLFLIIVAAAATMTGCIKEWKDKELTVGDSLPEFKVTMNDGSVVSKTNLTGDVSIVMFFHTTCPDCRKALPVMQRIYDEYSSSNMTFVLVSRAEEEDSIRVFWEENKLNMPYSAQRDRLIYEKFAMSRIPRIYVNDKNGIIRHIFTDDPIPAYEDLKSAIEDSLL